MLRHGPSPMSESIKRLNQHMFWVFLSIEQSSREINVEMAEYSIDMHALTIVFSEIQHDTENNKTDPFELQVQPISYFCQWREQKQWEINCLA